MTNAVHTEAPESHIKNSEKEPINSDNLTNSANLTTPDANNSIKMMQPKESVALPELTLTDKQAPASTMTKEEEIWSAAYDHEKEMNKKGRPDLFDYVDRETVKKQLEDPKTLALNLAQNFDKWDTNKDGMVTPSELESVFTDKNTSEQDKATAAAIRLAYTEFAHFNIAESETFGVFITKNDINGIGKMYDEDKRERGFDAWWKNTEDYAWGTIDKNGSMIHGLMWGALLYDKYFNAPDQYNKLFEDKQKELDKLPQLVDNPGPKLPLCTDQTTGTCSTY